jgi:hypothetical protein
MDTGIQTCTHNRLWQRSPLTYRQIEQSREIAAAMVRTEKRDHDMTRAAMSAAKLLPHVDQWEVVA